MANFIDSKRMCLKSITSSEDVTTADTITSHFTFQKEGGGYEVTP